MASLVRARVNVFQIVGAKIVFPDRRGGIARVARAGPVVLLENFVRDLSDVRALSGLFAVVVSDIASNSSSPTCARAGQRRCLPALRRTLAHSRPAWSAEFRVRDSKCGPRRRFFPPLRAPPRGSPSSGPSRIDGSTFPCSAILRPKNPARLGQIRIPVHAENVRARFRKALQMPRRAFREKNPRHAVVAERFENRSAWQEVRIRHIRWHSIRPPTCRKVAPPPRPPRSAISDTPTVARAIRSSNSRTTSGCSRSICFASRNIAARASLDHVARKRPRRCRETDHRNIGPGLACRCCESRRPRISFPARDRNRAAG